MYSEPKAQRVIRFIECLRHTKGEFHGKPFKLLPWQEKIIKDVFGTVREDDPSMRQYTTAYVEIPKKQGKSELGAAIALNMLVNDDEWKAEVYSCAADRQQAAIVFDVAVDMVKQSPALMKRIKIIPSMKRMVYQPTGSIYQVLSSEVATKHGLNVSACIFDELHTQPTRALYDVMTQGSGDARKQPLWFFLTTAGTDRNSICWEVHQKALDILEGRKHDPRFYPVIFGLPDEADWQDEKNWYIANPSLGQTISIDKVRDAYRKALETPADENMFRQLRLNQWVKQSIRWMPMDRWDENGGVVNPIALEGRACYAGLDLSSTFDLTTLVLVFPPGDETEPYTVLPFFWLPEDTLPLRVRRDHVMYDTWERQGFIKTTEGNVVHYGFIERFICELGERYNIREIAYDRWNATMMVQALQDDGFTMLWLDLSLSPPILKRWNGSTWVSVGAQEVKTSGISIGSNNVAITTENFLLQLLDPSNNENVLMEMSANGHVGFKQLYADDVISDSVAPAYSGSTWLWVDPSIATPTETDFRSLGEAVAVLNNKYLHEDVHIYLPWGTDVYEPSGVLIQGIFGPGKLTIHGYGDYSILNSYIRVKGCHATICFQDLYLRESRTLNGSNRQPYLVELQMDYYVEFTGCTLDANSITYDSVYSRGSYAYFDSCGFYNALQGLEVYTGQAYMMNCCGSCSWSMMCYGGIIIASGSVPGGSRGTGNGRMIEIYLVTSVAPIPMATMSNREWGTMGQNYLRSLFALGFQAFLIIICVAIYAVLVQSIAVGSDVVSAIWTCVGYSVLLCFCLFKTSSLSKAVFGAH